MNPGHKADFVLPVCSELQPVSSEAASMKKHIHDDRQRIYRRSYSLTLHSMDLSNFTGTKPLSARH